MPSLTPIEIFRVPVIGQAYAGLAVPQDFDEIVAWREIRPIKGAGPYDTYAAIQACGDSLKDDNIVDGDWLIILYTRFANEGDLVVAITPFGRTIKYLQLPDEDSVFLKGANPAYEDKLWLREDVKIHRAL